MRRMRCASTHLNSPGPKAGGTTCMFLGAATGRPPPATLIDQGFINNPNLSDQEPFAAGINCLLSYDRNPGCPLYVLTKYQPIERGRTLFLRHLIELDPWTFIDASLQFSLCDTTRMLTMGECVGANLHIAWSSLSNPCQETRDNRTVSSLHSSGVSPAMALPLYQILGDYD